MPAIIPAPARLATFLIGATAYSFSRWNLKFTLDTGKVLHFNSQTDGNNNYWPTVFTNFASGSGSASGAVDHAVNAIPVGAGLYIGSAGTASCLHATGEGFTAPIVINDNDMGSDASGSDPGQRGIAFELTGPPSRVFA